MSEQDHSPDTASLALRAALDSTAALNRISSHEAECARRYGDMSVSISRFHSRMDQFVTAQESAEREARERRERWDKEDRDRRERRGRETRQATFTATLAAMSSLVATLTVVGMHFWK